MNIYSGHYFEQKFSYISYITVCVQIILNITQLFLIIRNDYKKMHLQNMNVVSSFIICIMILANVSVLKNLVFSISSIGVFARASIGLIALNLIRYLSQDNLLSINQYDKFWIENEFYYLLMVFTSCLLIIQMLNIHHNMLMYILSVLICYIFIKHSVIVSAAISGLFVLSMGYLYIKNIVQEPKIKSIIRTSDNILEEYEDFTVCKSNDMHIYIAKDNGVNYFVGIDEVGSIRIVDDSIVNKLVINNCVEVEENMFINHIEKINLLLPDHHHILKEYLVIADVDNVFNSFNVNFTPFLNVYNIHSPFYLQNIYNMDDELSDTYLLYDNIRIGQRNHMNEILININAYSIDENGVKRFVFDLRDGDLYILNKAKYIKCNYSLKDFAEQNIYFVDNSLVDITEFTQHSFNNYNCQFDSCIFDENKCTVYYRNSDNVICKDCIGDVVEYCGTKVVIFNCDKVQVNDDNKVCYNNVVLNLDTPYAINNQRSDGHYLIYKNMTCKLLAGNVPYVNCYFNTYEKLKFMNNANDDMCIGGFSPANNNRLAKDVVAIYEPLKCVQVDENQVYYQFNNKMWLLGSLGYLRDNGVYIVNLSDNNVYYYDSNGEKRQFSKKSADNNVDTLNEVFYRDIFINV